MGRLCVTWLWYIVRPIVHLVCVFPGSTREPTCIYMKKKIHEFFNTYNNSHSFRESAVLSLCREKDNTLWDADCAHSLMSVVVLWLWGKQQKGLHHFFSLSISNNLIQHVMSFCHHTFSPPLNCAALLIIEICKFLMHVINFYTLSFSLFWAVIHSAASNIFFSLIMFYLFRGRWSSDIFFKWLRFIFVIQWTGFMLGLFHGYLLVKFIQSG